VRPGWSGILALSRLVAGILVGHARKSRRYPIEQPTKFDFVISIKTATALRLTLPPAFARDRRRSHQMRRQALRAPAAAVLRYWASVLTTFDSERVLLLVEYLSRARTMSSYFANVVTGSFGTKCTIL
jgi:hypothetical protein